MKLADKPVFSAIGDSISQNFYETGLTYKQWLVGMLASNHEMLLDSNKCVVTPDVAAKWMINQANAIISELEKEND